MKQEDSETSKTNTKHEIQGKTAGQHYKNLVKTKEQENRKTVKRLIITKSRHKPRTQ